MQKVCIFTVFPGEAIFPTSDLTHMGDTSQAYTRAHLHAARIAAKRRVLSYVKQDDEGRRCGFGPSAIADPTSSLCHIAQLGIASYFDFGSTTWRPLSAEQADVPDVRSISKKR